jgi:hypothetical protein
LQGEFLSEDPVFLGPPTSQNLTNPQSLNSYSYAEDNPITKKDPTGKGLLDDLIGGLLAITLAPQRAYAPASQSDLANMESKPPTILIGGEAEVVDTLSVPEGSNVRFSQSTVSPNFDKNGSMSGASRESVIDSLQNGSMSPDELPINYVQVGDYRVIENNRSYATLLQAGIPEEAMQFNEADNSTEVDAILQRINVHLSKNNLPATGTHSVQIR